jgi:hypothetical protein
MIWFQQPLPPSQARPSLVPVLWWTSPPVIYFFLLARAEVSSSTPAIYHYSPYKYYCMYMLHIHTVRQSTASTTTTATFAATSYIIACLPPPLPQAAPEPILSPCSVSGLSKAHGTDSPLPSRGTKKGNKREIDKRDQSPYRTPGLVDTQPAACEKKCHFPADQISSYRIIPHSTTSSITRPPATVSVGALNSFPFAGGWWPVWATERRGSRNLAV